MNDRNQSSLLSFIFLLSVRELTFLLPVKTIFLIFTFGPFRHVEREVDELRSARHRLDFRRHLGVLEALFLEHVADDARHLPHERRIDEGVEPDFGHRVLQPLVDLRRLDFFRADVVDDLDALALFHVVRDQLADHAVREGVRLALDPQVVEKVRVPQAEKVLVNGLLGRLVVRRPDALGRLTGLELDVVEVGLESMSEVPPCASKQGPIRYTTGPEPAGGSAAGGGTSGAAEPRPGCRLRRGRGRRRRLLRLRTGAARPTARPRPRQSLDA